MEPDVYGQLMCQLLWRLLLMLLIMRWRQFRPLLTCR